MMPLISMVVLKNSYHVKPEALLLFTVLALAAVSVLSLKPGLLERRRRCFAVAFGVVAGFGRLGNDAGDVGNPNANV